MELDYWKTMLDQCWRSIANIYHNDLSLFTTVFPYINIHKIFNVMFIIVLNYTSSSRDILKSVMTSYCVNDANQVTQSVTDLTLRVVQATSHPEKSGIKR